MLKKTLSKWLSITYIGIVFTVIVCFLAVGGGRTGRNVNIACNAKGVLSVNELELKYVNAYRFSQNGKGASSISGKIYKNGDVIGTVGLQIYFDYLFNSGMLTLHTTKVNYNVENNVSISLISKLFPAMYYAVGSEQKIAIFKMGNGYRLDYNAFPINYCN